MNWATFFVVRISTGEWQVIDTSARDATEAVTKSGWQVHEVFVRELTANDVRALHGMKHGRMRPQTPQGVLL